MALRNLLMSVGVAALMAGAATAQETSGDAATGTVTGDAATTGTTDMNTGAAAPAAEFTSLEDMTVGDVIGLNVVSTNGEEIGEIDYVIEDAGGASAVIGIGGFLGLGEYTVALPLSDFDYDSEQQVLTLGTDKETLKAEPEIDESGLESLPDETPVASLMEAEAETEMEGSTDTDASTDEGAEAGSDASTDAEADASGDSDAMESDAAEGEAAESEAGDAEAAADSAASEAEDAAGEAADAAGEAADAAGEAAEDAADAAGNAAEEAGDAVSEGAEAATDEVLEEEENSGN